MSIYSEKVEWIRESIDSILNQTFSDFEFIIINDNPKREENQKILSEYSYKDNRIRIITNEKNIGLTKSLNKGLDIAKGRYVARMDADDISLPTRFQKQVDFLENNSEYIVCGSDISYFGQKRRFTYSDWIKNENDEVKASLIFNNCFAHSTVMIRKSVLDQNNICYDENYRQTQDYRLWEMLSDYGKYYNLQEKLLKYRISKDQVSNKDNEKQVNLGNKVRRLVILKWLKSIDIECDENTLDNYLQINKRSFILRKANKLKVSNCYTKTFLKYLYFSKQKSKLETFIYYYFYGDFFRFDLKTNLRFIALLGNLKKAI